MRKDIAKKTTLILTVSLAALLTASCSKKPKTVNLRPEPKKTLVLEKSISIDDYLNRKKETTEGIPDEVLTESLWDETYSTGLLFVDHKARHVGDIIKINIVESSSAEKKASTKTSRNSSLDAGIDTFLGIPSNMGVKNFLGTGQPFSPNLKANYKNSFDGSGTTTRSGKITAIVSAQVVEVLANKNLKVRGHREIKVNNENQIIMIEGIIRPQDIDEANSVKSTSIANVRIEYFGKGVIGDKQRVGWLSKFFDVIWPF